MKYRAEIDGLRAIAVVPVILFHAGFEAFSGGFIGVDVFFVISGYLITTIIVEEIGKGSFSIVSFYERRARRILPALFFVMLVCIPFAWFWMLPSQMRDFSQSLIAVSVFASNVLFWWESGYFDTAAEEKPLLHTWSLAVEEQYYVLFPLFLLLFWRWGKGTIFVTLVIITLASLAASEWGWRNQPTANFYFIFTRAWELGIGSIAALIIQNRGVMKNELLSGLGLLAIVASIFLYSEHTPFPSLYALLPVGGTALLILFAQRETLAAKLLSTKAFVGIGLISYSAYLWHQPLFAFARVKLTQAPSVELMLGLAVASIALGALSWRFIERPFRDRKKLSRQTVFVFAAIASLCFCIFGALGHQTRGYSDQRAYLDFVGREMAITELSRERGRGIRSGLCHFNTRGLHRTPDAFLENWDCQANEDGLIPTGILVTGDSLSADKAFALRLSGYDVYQLTGLDCGLTKLQGARSGSFCDQMLEKARSLISRSGVKKVFLSNRFQDWEISEENLRSIIDFWSQVDAQVYLWSPMPRFKDQIKSYLRGVSPLPGPDYTQEDAFYATLSRMTLPENITIIRTTDYWCPRGSEDETCNSFSEDQILMIDEDHLNAEGARLFGERVVQSTFFQDILAQPK